jgi:hypothetical protein
LLPYPSLSGLEVRALLASAVPNIWRVSRRAEREIWKLGRSGAMESSSDGSDSGMLQLKVVKRAFSMKTMPEKELLRESEGGQRN